MSRQRPNVDRRVVEPGESHHPIWRNPITRSGETPSRSAGLRGGGSTATGLSRDAAGTNPAGSVQHNAVVIGARPATEPPTIRSTPICPLDLSPARPLAGSTDAEVGGCAQARRAQQAFRRADA